MRRELVLPNCLPQIVYHGPVDLFPLHGESQDIDLLHYPVKVLKLLGIDDVDIGCLGFKHNARQLDASRVQHRPHSILLVLMF